jgi:2-keto-4-pentenoate hydratase
VTAHAAIAERLWRAGREGGLVPAPTRALPGLTEDDAYAIQRTVLERCKRDGDRGAGWKVGMTSAVGRRPESPGPIYGELLASMIVPPGEPLVAAELHEPDVEGEIAFVLDRPLRGPGATVADVRDAARGVLPAIEVIAGRLEPGDHTVADFIADNAFSARAVLGDTLSPLDGLDLRLVGMVHSRDGAVVGTGAGARVLGDPAASVAWLANALAAAGGQLDAGAVVLSGSVAPAVRARSGDAFRVEFDRLGTVSLAFA